MPSSRLSSRLSRITLREPFASECNAITDLCLRSKAYWEYSDVFIEACREELTVSPQTLARSFCRVALKDSKVVGFLEVVLGGDRAELEKLFIDPKSIGTGLGGRLFVLGADHARKAGASLLAITADPDAAAFYKRMGAAQIGTTESGSIPGRLLPVLELKLR